MRQGGWGGETKGRVPLLHHDRALVIRTTLFKEEDDYRAPIVVYEARRSYLKRAYMLGEGFARP